MSKSLCKEIGELLKSQNATLSVAESCTSGIVAAKITSVQGSSSYFKGGIIAYWNEIKQQYLGVDEDNLLRFSAVSQEVALQMVVGVKEQFQTDYALATTGYAGPDGEQVGQVFVAIATPKSVLVEAYFLHGNREEIRRQTGEYALRFLLSAIKREKK